MAFDPRGPQIAQAVVSTKRRATKIHYIAIILSIVCSIIVGCSETLKKSRGHPGKKVETHGYDEKDESVVTLQFSDIQIPSGENSEELSFEITDGIRSFHIFGHGDSHCLYKVSSLVGPPPENIEYVVEDAAESIIRSRSGFTPGTGGILFPSHNRVDIVPGTWRFRLHCIPSLLEVDANEATDISIVLKKQTDTETMGVLSLHFFFNGSLDWDDATVSKDPMFIKMLSHLRKFFSDIDISLNVTGHTNLAFPARFPNFDGFPDAPLEHAAVNVFFGDFEENKSGSVEGKSLGLPGPSLTTDSPRAGVVVRTNISRFSAAALARNAAHEIGHYLGLEHLATDQLDDTRQFDTGNVMSAARFFFREEEARFTAQQREVLFNNPLVRLEN